MMLNITEYVQLIINLTCTVYVVYSLFCIIRVNSYI